MSYIKFICEKCGGDDVSVDTASRWNLTTQEWETASVFDKGAGCDDCGTETRLKEVELTAEEIKNLPVTKKFDILFVQMPQDTIVYTNNTETIGDIVVHFPVTNTTLHRTPIAINGTATDWLNRLNDLSKDSSKFLEEFLIQNTKG